jgi:3',5'-cyclic AMP phosphodiesterase CpdA
LIIGSPTLRIIHVSDIHFWQYTFNPFLLMSKRLPGMASLIMGRAKRFRLERIPDLVERVVSLNADHILITGDLTTTALHSEFQAARSALSEWLVDPARVTVLPGNHDRYTIRAHRGRHFESYFGGFSPGGIFPWLRMVDPETAILGLDPTRAAILASGRLPRAQLIRAKEILARAGPVTRLLVACHYPVEVPAEYRRHYAGKRLVDANELADWLRTIGPHLYCCGHIHAPWAFSPESIPHQLCLNPGAPLMVDRSGHRPPGFLEIELDGADVTVNHHGWTGEAWRVNEIQRALGFFPNRDGR